LAGWGAAAGKLAAMVGLPAIGVVVGAGVVEAAGVELEFDAQAARISANEPRKSEEPKRVVFIFERNLL
jgi:hypothetical protein